MLYRDLSNFTQIQSKNILCYTTVDVDKNQIHQIKKGNPETNFFGCSSFQGVFTPDGFKRGAHFLIFEDKDNIDIYPVIFESDGTNAKEKTIEYCNKIKNEFGQPDVVLMHATPGFEERVLEGIESVFHSQVPVYGGSAADDDITGKWFIFLNDKFFSSGVLLVAFKNKAGKVYGSFLSGYMQTQKKGIVTKVDGRVIFEIDHRPAAEVYNEWTKGSISQYLETGGVILAPTTLHPVGRIVDEHLGIRHFLLSHPHMVIKENKALSLFTEFTKGDEIILMNGYVGALISRTKLVYEKAMGFDLKKVSLKGAILIYCGGCVGAIMNHVDDVVKEYKNAIGMGVPFLGAATFGEQGCFITKEKHNRHGNLMTDNILFS